MKTLFFFTLFLALSSAGFTQNNKMLPPDSSKPFVLGLVDHIRSAELGENRVLNIYLPEGYNKNDSITYPVTYLLDGSADEDFIHVAGLYQFYNFDWIRRVPRSIVVGIATVDRRRDLTYPTTLKKDKERYPTTGGSAKFIAFIEKELQPFIEKKYKGSYERTLIGQSLGGLFATEILFKKRHLFNKYLIVSPSLWWDNGSLLTLPQQQLLDSINRKIDVYIAVGKEGLTPTEIPHVMEVDANMLADTIKESGNTNIRLHFDYLPEEDHATIMHVAVMNGLKFLYGK